MNNKPIAWYDPTNGMVSTDKDSPLFTPLGQVLPLYTQRTWVGLTGEEKQEWITAMPWPPQPGHLMVLIEGVESELKEKNDRTL